MDEVRCGGVYVLLEVELGPASELSLDVVPVVPVIPAVPVVLFEVSVEPFAEP